MGQGGRSNAARLIFGQRPQSCPNCRIAWHASSRRNSLRLGLWGDERGQEKSNLTEISHARGTPDKESNSNRQHCGSGSAPSASGDARQTRRSGGWALAQRRDHSAARAVTRARRDAEAIRPPQGAGRPPCEVRGRNSVHGRATQAARRLAPVRRPSRRRYYFSSDAGSLTFFPLPIGSLQMVMIRRFSILGRRRPRIGAMPGIDREPDCPTL